MAITNGYCALAELKDYLLAQRTYTAATISFDAATKEIRDSAKGMKRFQDNIRIQVSGSTSNDGFYTITTGSNPDKVVVSEALVNEAAGDTVTITDVSDQADDATLEITIEAVSRGIDFDTKRRFFSTAEDEDRYETAESGTVLFPRDDILSLTALATDLTGNRTYPTAWATTDYDLLPYNAALDGKPYTRIEITPLGRYSFPSYKRGIKLTGKFGYSSTTPALVKKACLLQSSRLAKRKDAPFGVAGTTPLGASILIAELDPDVKRLLDPVRKVGL